MPRDNLAGMRFGSLKVVKFSHRKEHSSMWECVCACGKTVVCKGYDIKALRKTNCGCGCKPPKQTVCLKIGQAVQFNPVTVCTGFKPEDSDCSFVQGKIVYINIPHKWFSVTYGDPIVRTSFKFSDVGKDVQICG